ncbi:MULTISPECIES: MBL fold metallo-hydrolase [Psychrilyobacter]|uniref:MBL fold metallo-hydrolase n=1 Tax=Psychrilyobacter piezotolerans TaxID=2293438 RepID=A0ABX9KKR1_9FUSO|nr:MULTISPECIES: MBL fold metallo-hydrolase [Psychrilyobacter]MCS5422045.1 MBL fold metallo-hydrolase [Psychrilyobacter sp. S5]NDI76363.1 MBL fold metallo-hydrolase [Psychrilyobacter piezotolerans]RDE65961.1 MBL fold metallo-hydrolase [Psychrilyobacter sp. S5]REI43139.1 MBL fold metallo-hydrolase [Psychrilyobacter piezotolerans]
MKVSILGSGSSGNSIFVEVDKVKILIDAGFSGKKIKEKLEVIGEDINDIQALLITHEHGDHVLGAGIISRKYKLPIYITKESYNACQHKLGKIEPSNLNFIDGKFYLDNISITPFDVMHDAERTIGFSVEYMEKKLTLATDIGHITNIVREQFKGSQIAIIECNYDYNMLMNCDYPWDLKSRVKGRNGHLCNEDTAKFLTELYHEDLEKVYLVHVSNDSNCYDLAYNTVEFELIKNDINIDLEIVRQNTVTPIYKSKK